MAPGLNQHSGDQDLFGHEEDISLSEAQDRFQQELTMLNDLKRIVAECASLEELQKPSIVEQLKDVISCLSWCIRDLRTIQTKQTMALEKFRKIAGKDWRSSKYVWAISSSWSGPVCIFIFTPQVFEWTWAWALLELLNVWLCKVDISAGHYKGNGMF